MAGVKKKPTKGGLYQAHYTDFTGKRRYFTALTRSAAKSLAQRKETEHRLIRQGVLPVPAVSAKHRTGSFAEVVKEYLAWGETQGGRGGRSWSKEHAKNRRVQLTWWGQRLALEVLADLDDILPRVEEALRELLGQGQTGKTVANKIEGLRGFCIWCEKRRYIPANPLKALTPLDTTPQTKRRALTSEELIRLLEVAPADRRLLYETAFTSGLRAGELRSLSLDHIDTERGGLHIEATWTKNRKPGFQPLPWSLIHRLKAFAESGEPVRLYEKAFSFCGKKRKTELPVRPLLYVPSQMDRSLGRDLEAAEIPKYTPKGKVDFHALRHTFVTRLFETGDVSPKEAQELARHASLDMTMGRYAHTRDDRLRTAVERLGEDVLFVERVPGEYRQAVGAEPENATPEKTEGCASKKLVAGVGFEPTTFGL